MNSESPDRQAIAVNDSPWLTHRLVDLAIARKVSVSETFDMRDECYRVGATFLGDLLGRVLDDRAAAELGPEQPE